LLFGVGGSLLRTRFFSSVARKMPQSLAARGFSWWAGVAVLVLLGPITFFWFQTWGQKQFPAGPIFPETITTGVVVWALGDALIGASLFLVWHFLGARRKRPAGPQLALASVPQVPAGTEETGGPSGGAIQTAGGYNRQAFASYGITEPTGRVIDWVNVGKGFLLALASVVAVYLAVFFFQWAWSSDVRIWVFNIRPVTTMYLPVYLSYVWPFFVYLLVVSTVLFGQLRPRAATLGRFMATVTSILVVGFVGLIGVEYGAMWATGQLATTTQPLLSIVAFQFVPVFVIIGTLLSYFFWKTGRIWTGVFAATLLVTGMLVVNTALSAPPW
jgi:hypothetical protein